MSSTDATGPGAPPAVALSAADVGAMRRLLERLDPGLRVVEGADAQRPGLSEAECIDLLRELEDLKAAAAGAQAAVTAHLSRLRLDAEQGAGVAADRRGRGLASEVALARRLSPHHGGRHLGMARALREDMPCTLAALRRGELSEWRATLLVRESICLGAEERRALDAELWQDPARVAGMGDRQLVAEAKRVAYRLDPHSVVDRAARAERERFVGIRPAPDTMAYLTALLPVAQAVAAHASLGAAADSARAAGDERGRGRGQIMADALVARLTGSDAEVPARVHLQLVMTDQSLAGGDEPASVPEHGTVPAGWARELLRRALADEGGCGVWVRRLLTDPVGHLVAMESRARHAPPGLAHYIATRDAGRCRTPHCDAPVRHIDHVVDHAKGGATDEANLGGRCERCNQDKAAPGWRSLPLGRGDPSAPRAGPLIRTRTPTGHVHTSPPPRLPHAG
ncbi:DUF222 domain-containing protein [Georgenia satyanarayanai]|uniref:HNH endonuclease n=1 Tax=Georgenia satyanarayanai TaxID=860221 RepID=UPI00203BA49C|nr:DUF222 domain-containing protein [Georgenia satyanarayanai]MCM3660335.1 DUF222 domain-containing protein [Georgenia satyanarayanai]